MNIKKKDRHILLFLIVMISSAINRLETPLIKGIPYGMDFYEFVSYVFSSNTPFDILRLPHGPVFYLFLLPFKSLGLEFFLTFGAYVLPALFSLTVLPLYFLGKRIFRSRDVGYLSLLMAGSVNILIHQTGSTVIPEALGLMFAGLSSLFLFEFLEERDFKNIFLSILFLILTSLTHHLTTLIFITSLLFALLPFAISSKGFLDGKRRLIIYVLALFFSCLFMLWYWFTFTFNYTLKPILEILGKNHWLLLIVLLCGGLAMLLYPHIIEFLSRPFKLSILPWVLSLSLYGLFVAFISFSEFGLLLTPVIFYGLPIMFSFAPLLCVGTRFFFQEEKSRIKKHLVLSLILIPTLLSASFLSFRETAFLSYRIISLSLFFSNTLVAYGILRTVNIFSKNTRLLIIVILSCLIFYLSLTSTPGKEFLCGIEEGYSKEELKAAKILVKNLDEVFTVDTDVRFGNLLLFYSGGKFGGIVGNRMYFQNISDNWLVQASQGNVVHMPEPVRFIVVTKSMLKEEGGVVVLPFYMTLKPINLKDVDLLNNYEGVVRVLDYQDVTIFVIDS